MPHWERNISAASQQATNAPQSSATTARPTTRRKAIRRLKRSSSKRPACARTHSSWGLTHPLAVHPTPCRVIGCPGNIQMRSTFKEPQKFCGPATLQTPQFLQRRLQPSCVEARVTRTHEFPRPSLWEPVAPCVSARSTSSISGDCHDRLVGVQATDSVRLSFPSVLLFMMVALFMAAVGN